MFNESPVQSQPARKILSVREQAIVRHCWIINKHERDKLNKFFVVQDSYDAVEKDFTVDQTECKRYLRHEGQDYEVVLCSPVRVLKAHGEVGLSFRVNFIAGLRVVLIREWKESTQRESTD
jgi:hypothetical protein